MSLKKAVIYTGIWVMITLAGCSRFLEVTPVGRTTIPVLFSDMDGIRAAVYGMYSTTYHYYSSRFYSYPEIVGDGLSLDVSRATETLRQVYNFNALPEDEAGIVGQMWSDIFEALANINNVLFYLPDLERKFPEYRDELVYYRAEALFLRALCHFDLVRVYAQPYGYTTDASHLGVPVLTRTPGPDDNVSRKPVKEVYDAVISDLQQAETLFGDTRRNVRPANMKQYFASVEAVQGLLSRVYLYKGDWDNAIRHAGEVISRIPLAEGQAYVDMFRQLNSPEAEAIFRLNGTDKSSSLLTFYNVLTTDVNGSVSYIIPVASMADKLAAHYTDSNDIRLRELMFSFTVSGGGTTIAHDYYTNKFNVIQNSADSERQYYNPIVLRVSEMYLNRAEAYVRKGLLREAAADVRQIMARAVQKPVIEVQVPETDVVLLGKIIEEERMRELCFEGHRFFDLARRGVSVVRDSRSTAQMKELSYPNDRFVLPIPLRELQTNKNMVPNPGYN